MLNALMTKATLIAFICSVPFSAHAMADAPKSINIPAGELLPALESFSKQAAVELVYQPAQLKSYRTGGARGIYTPEAAIRILLKGTPLELRTDLSGAMLIAPPHAKTTSDSSSSTKNDEAKEGKKSSSDTFRLAQVDQGSSAGAPTVEKKNERATENRPVALEEVVVTAQKRSENLMDVPASLTALSAATLEAQGVTNFSDYMTLVPSLSDFSEGAEGHAAIILRGLNTGYYQFSNTVGYYIDDIPFSATSPLSYGEYLALDPDLTDIDPLEVLKGPQGTLYGASTLGGLIKVVAKQADLNSNGAEVRLDGSTIDRGGSGYGMAGVVNVALIPGELALRVSGFDRDTPGYMTNVELGTTQRNVSRKEGGRISLRWAPSENLDIKVSAFLQSLFVHGWKDQGLQAGAVAVLCADLRRPEVPRSPQPTVLQPDACSMRGRLHCGTAATAGSGEARSAAGEKGSDELGATEPVSTSGSEIIAPVVASRAECAIHSCGVLVSSVQFPAEAEFAREPLESAVVAASNRMTVCESGALQSRAACTAAPACGASNASKN